MLTMSVYKHTQTYHETYWRRHPNDEAIGPKTYNLAIKYEKFHINARATLDTETANLYSHPEKTIRQLIYKSTFALWNITAK